MIHRSSFQLTLVTLAACTLVFAGPAPADTLEPTTAILALGLNESTSDDYALFHGYVRVSDGVGGYLQFKWGGNHCPGFDASAESVAALQRGMNNPRVLLRARTKPGAGGNKCLVGFDLVLRSDLGALP